MQPDRNDRLLTRRDVEEIFGITRRFLELAALKGNGPTMIKIGRSVRYRSSDIREWIDAHEVRSTSESAGR